MPEPITLAGCHITASCPEISLDGDRVVVTGALASDHDVEETVIISRELFDRAVAKLAELEVSDV